MFMNQLSHQTDIDRYNVFEDIASLMYNLSCIIRANIETETIVINLQDKSSGFHITCKNSKNMKS